MVSCGLITVFEIAFYTRYSICFIAIYGILFLDLGTVFILKEMLLNVASTVIISL